MAKGKQPSKPFTSLFQGIFRFFRKGRQAIEGWLQAWVVKVKRRSRYNQAGFVLPTVTMVMLVVVLLSLAITFRAFDRAQDARYSKVSEKAFNAAAPALDRANAKIRQALQEVSQISDTEIYNILRTYTFGDEEQVQVRYDVNGTGGIQLNGPDGDGGTLKDNEAIETAWRFPFDTDNNGLFDSFSIYGIFFRTPTPGEVRSPLDSRALPLPSLGLSGQEECAAYSGGVDSLVTDEGLTPNRGKFKKSIFAYTVTFPVTEEMIEDEGLNGFEANQGAPGFAPLESQQDWSIKPLNGVVYIDDLEINPGPEFNLNVGLYAESNLITSPFDNNIRIFQITGQNSCFYDPDLSKIVVGGNVINGMVGNETEQNPVDVDLYQGAEADIDTVQISNANQSTGNSSYQAMYNDRAYRERLEHLVQVQLGENEEDDGNDPPTVRQLVEQLVEEGVPIAEARRTELERYFKARLRKVPLAEVAIDYQTQNLLDPTGTGNELAVPDAWAERPEEITVTEGQLEATEPTEETQKTGIEEYLGDRVLVGNNQPALEYVNGRWDIAEEELGEWTDSGEPRDRLSRVEILSDAIDKDRGGFWERAAARLPKTYVEGVGGLRVITGGGIYDPASSFLPRPSFTGGAYDDPATAGTTETYPIVWPDTMPMSDPNDPNIPPQKGDLVMRATAVYHYAVDAIDPSNEDTEQLPIACVSSYYDPSTSATATDPTISNNGIAYQPPTTARPTGQATENATGITGSGNADLDTQASYVFPDGRFANGPLREALLKAEDERNIADWSAIDATLCALDINSGAINPDNSLIPDLAIYETAFLDARQVKAVDADDTNTPVDETFTLSSPLDGNVGAANLSTEYKLPLEDRQPLEIRATVLDLGLLRTTTDIDIADNTGIEELDPEYLLPYSGLIYASRDDALPDRSNREAGDDGTWDEDLSKALSPVDYKLDPTRRPNGILLINGGSLGRDTTVDDEADVLKEKGLTLVSNLPVYIKGNFNTHDQEEFLDELDPDYGNFYNREDINPDFACRPGDPIREELEQPCGDGDNWRPATILSDAITLLSKNFLFGFRNEGDFDLRNNAGTNVPGNAIAIGYDLDGSGTIDGATQPENNYGIDLNGNGTLGDTVAETEVTAKAARQLNGFNGYNDFGVNGLSSGATFEVDGANVTLNDNDYRNNNNNAVNSSYFNNFVTPIQRRGQFSEYVMEVCQKLPVSACQPQDWFVDAAGTNTATSQIGSTPGEAGTTAQPPSDALQRFPRRVAFLRDPATFELELDGNSPIPLGINGGTIACFDSGGGTYNGNTCQAGQPPAANNALWFQTNDGGNRSWAAGNPLWYYDVDPNNTDHKTTPKTFATATVQQPLLVPVLQIHATTNQPGGNTFPRGDQVGNPASQETRWLPVVTEDEEYNLVLASGDVPGRPDETNGGLQNLARFLENWQSEGQTVAISGSFVQSGRGEYATAPYLGILGDVEIFGEAGTNARYNIQNAGRRVGYFNPPLRNWGFDVGLLTQPPDYFSRKFARLEKDQEGNYKIQRLFREVGKDDPWVKGLLCGKLADEPVDPEDEDADIEEATTNAVPDLVRGPLNCSEANNRTNAYDD